MSRSLRVRMIQKREGWYIQKYYPGIKEWHDKVGPCKTKRGCEQRRTAYLKTIDEEYCTRVGAQVMAKPWGEVRL